MIILLRICLIWEWNAVNDTFMSSMAMKFDTDLPGEMVYLIHTIVRSNKVRHKKKCLDN